MKNRHLIYCLPILAVSFVCLTLPSVGLAVDYGSILKKVQESVGQSSSTSELSQSELITGLKEALQVGTGNTVKALASEGGYYNNPKFKIPLPESVQKFEKVLRATGFDSQVNEFELSMNRAAEKAAPEAEELFLGAIKEMTFSDANKILKGADNEATLYFQDKTTDKLQSLLKPIVQQSMAQVGVTRSYKSVSDQIEVIPFASNYVVDLDSYVTEKSIAGLFLRLAEEEAKIRNDPAARVTDILKTVFSK